MKKFLKFLLGFIVLLIIGTAIVWFGFLKPDAPAISNEDRAKITLIPLPSELVINDGYFVIDNTLGHSFEDISNKKILKALDRFYSKLGIVMGVELKGNEGKSLIINCKDENSGFPSITDDESYSLKVSDSEIRLSANSEAGILHGLESILQLVQPLNEGWAIPEMELKDNPRYPWRGIMIDVARHWISKDVVLRNLEAMAAVKMNVMHLHLTDYQGFRVESKKFPKLHEMGSNGNYYSQKDIKEIIIFAANRGIRIVPEFDLPGHSTSWLVGHPELGSTPGPYVLDSIFGILEPLIDPTKETTYTFLEDFVEEMSALFPDEYLHIGGDEVNPEQWKQNPKIIAYMKENDIEDYHALQAHFNIRLQKILEKHGKKMMGWDEILHPALPKDGKVVQSWRNQKSLWDAVKAGNNAILSNGYYLDYKQSAAAHYKIDPLVIPNAVTIEIDSTNWRAWDCKLYVQGTEIPGELYIFGKGEDLRGVANFMNNSTSFATAKLKNGNLDFSMDTPFGKVDYDLIIKGDSLTGVAKLAVLSIDFKGKRIGGNDMPDGMELPKFEKIEPLTPEQETLILGGEACMWTEMANNVTLESRIWPRAAVVAEKLWSSNKLTTNVEDMYRRLISFDKDLEQLGLRHKSNNQSLLREMVPEQYLEPLLTLASVLEEDKFFNRMSIYEPRLYTTTPLDRMVDAVQPESYIAYVFNEEVDFYLETGDVEAKERIQGQLQVWSKNHGKLTPIFEIFQDPIEDADVAIPIGPFTEKMRLLKEVAPHSKHLSELASLALNAMEGNRPSNIDTLLLNANKAHGGTIMPIVNGLQKLLNSEE